MNCRLLTACLGLVAAACLCEVCLAQSTAQSEQKPRTQAIIVRVGKLNETVSLISSEWRDAIVYEMSQRIGYLLGSKDGTQGASYLTDFKIGLVDAREPLSIAEMDQRWENNLLELVVGSPSLQGADVKMRTLIYLGTLKGTLPSSQLAIAHMIRATNVESATDGLVLTTLYALAENAIGLSKPAYITCPLLSQALLLVDDIRARSKDVTVEAADVSQTANQLRIPIANRISEQLCAIP